MAKYYFCNGTKKNNLPCQLSVPKERDRCHFHGGGGDPGPKKIASAIFSVMKGAMDIMIYSHAFIQAGGFLFSLSEHGINIFSESAGYDAPSFGENLSLEENLYLKARELSEYYSVNESFITDNLSKKTEKDLRNLSSISNHILAALSDNNEQQIDDDYDKGMAASY